MEIPGWWSIGTSGKELGSEMNEPTISFDVRGLEFAPQLDITAYESSVCSMLLMLLMNNADIDKITKSIRRNGLGRHFKYELKAGKK